MKPATDRQLRKLRELALEFDNEITLDEAAAILREHQIPVPRSVDIMKLQNSLVVESEGDPLPGVRQWES